jgi:hypothetical protein
MQVARLVGMEAIAENTSLVQLPPAFSSSFLPYVLTLRQKQRARALCADHYVTKVKLNACGDAIGVVGYCYRSKPADAHRIHSMIGLRSPMLITAVRQGKYYLSWDLMLMVSGCFGRSHMLT